MKPELKLRLLAAVLVLTLGWAGSARAGTTINAVNKYAYGANLGWLNAYADGINGVQVTDYTLSGFIYAANVGWINVGSGAPANGIRYQNLSAGDFGVNNDGLGNLRGYAWAANVGWLNFENTGAPAVNLVTGQFSGYVWSENCGWISLSTAFSSLQTDHILTGPLDVNGLPIPWELANFGATGINPNGDADHDGQSNLAEYLAGTDPNNAGDYLHITSIVRGAAGDPIRVDLMWTYKLTRLYRLEHRPTLSPPTPWQQYVTGFESLLGWSNYAFHDTSSNSFYRVEAVRPLP